MFIYYQVIILNMSEKEFDDEELIKRLTSKEHLETYKRHLIKQRQYQNEYNRRKKEKMLKLQEDYEKLKKRVTQLESELESCKKNSKSNAISIMENKIKDELAK